MGGKRRSDTKTIRQHANRSIREEDDVTDSLMLHPQPSVSVEEFTNSKRAQHEDDMDPLKKLWPKRNSELTPVQRCFYPQVAADRIEKAKIDWHNPTKSTVQFSTMQTIYLIECRQQRTHRRAIRSRADPWRRYGVLQTIHRIGGWISTPVPGQKKNRQVKRIKAGTKLALPPPKTKPILSLKELFARPIVKPPAMLAKTNGNEKGTDDTLVIDEDVVGCQSPPKRSDDTTSSSEDK